MWVSPQTPACISGVQQNGTVREVLFRHRAVQDKEFKIKRMLITIQVPHYTKIWFKF
jgi:hypothetical protein